jgi:hypothetical protein
LSRCRDLIFYENYAFYALPDDLRDTQWAAGEHGLLRSGPWG